jgi:spore germination protein GerM
MKRLLFITSLILSLVFLSSCANKNIVKPSEGSNASQETKLPLTIKDFFSFKENTKYVYDGKGNEYASYNVLIDYLTESRVQTRTNNGGTTMVKVLENKDGKLTILLSREESYYRENLTQGASINGEILLQEPLVKGTTWTLADNRKRYISGVDVNVATALGKYKTLQVTTEDKENKTIDYYAPNIGLVKTVFISKGDEVSSSLSKIENNSLLNQTVKFYYPSADEGKLYFINKELSFNTNDITKIILEKAFKDLPKGNLGKVLGPNAKIKSLYLNKDNVVYVDFTKELLSEMNAGSGYEGMILQSITNTLGVYYGVDKVYITVEGDPYASGHYAMKKGEFFKVDVKNSVELRHLQINN